MNAAIQRHYQDMDAVIQRFYQDRNWRLETPNITQHIMAHFFSKPGFFRAYKRIFGNAITFDLGLVARNMDVVIEQDGFIFSSKTNSKG